MIYTLTMNPSIDYFVTLSDHLLIDEVNRTVDENFKPGGKGLNVSTILSVLGYPSVAIALLGGFTGEYIKQSFGQSNLIKLDPIKVEGINRINMKAHYNHSALCINGKGPIVDNITKDLIITKINQLQENDWFIISGSSPEGVDSNYLIEISNLVHQKKANLVIDMEKIDIHILSQCKPTLIKPNLYEFGLIMGNDNISLLNIKEEMIKLNHLGISQILVSLGEDGAILLNQNQFYRLEQEPINAVNKVGSGDAMLASFLAKLISTNDIVSSLKWAGAAGAAVASTLEDIDLSSIKQQLNKVTVTKI
ncbi:1-phosphofructokinase family hexose kinase [Anaerorhabdus sp.]|uniref:1-phosphofructokinase family hexose kinase n=1 Tax=Anaerorhabdus sp. TaxID=1872524 RepID=UPI002FCAE07E